MDTLQHAAQAPVPYDEKLPGTLYFQENMNMTKLQGGRVFDSTNQQHPPDILKLWNRRQAVPEDLRSTLILENKRRHLESEMSVKWEIMQREVAESEAKLHAEMQELREQENAKNQRPIEEYYAQTNAQQPTAPMPKIFPEEVKLDFLQSLMPTDLPQVSPFQLSAGVPEPISSKMRQAPWEVTR